MVSPPGRPLVIAHRGASGYLPEHTQQAKALAYGQGADVLEQDVVATRDGRLVVLHDLFLERVSDVARRYPGRARADGHWYARDFTLAELRGLAVTERLSAAGDAAAFPGRFPPWQGEFRLHALEDELALLRGLNATTGREVGAYPEIKCPAWHREAGIDLGVLLAETLEAELAARGPLPLWLQCFDPAELRRLHAQGFRLPMTQLIGRVPAEQGDWAGQDPLSTAGLAVLARHCSAIGPWLGHVWRDGRDTGLVARAHEVGLAVHPWTLRRDRLPEGCQDAEALVAQLCHDIGVDGLFTDHPDLVVRARARVGERTGALD
ncbi:MAG: glycerophosphodiester phosphodiesterase [Gammaproteobacteria bacterium]|nr:glycerophosphodiester phosphodiesterase [Gammaproteobacteria bacterium]TVQ45195.1 MAG: glycerophosphodiester phosphodiesterase [Gammaproteobacteria bacterium]